MTTDERFKKLLEATPKQLEQFDAMFRGEDPAPRQSLRLMRMGQAAAETGLSRSTLWRAIKDGRLRATEIRQGTFRIPESELRRFVGVGE